MELQKTKGGKRHWVKLEQPQANMLLTMTGQHGQRATEKRQRFKSPKAAKAALDAALAALIADGYRDVADPGKEPTAAPRNPTLEAAIRANRTDGAAYDVFADWLLQQNAPLGELIAMARANKTARVKKLIDALGLPGPGLATYGWRFGLLEWLRLENEVDWMDDNFDAAALAHRVFAQPVCMALEELRIGVMRWMHGTTDIPAVIDAAKRYDWAPYLASLRVGDVTEMDMAHYTAGDIGKRITKSFPRLRTLFVHTGGPFDVCGLALPELRELTVETCALDKEQLSGLLSAKLPALSRLELWFGSERYNCDANVAGLKRLLSGKVHAGVTDLGLRNSEFANDIADALPKSDIAGRVTRLDLSMGTMTDDGANALIAGRKAFGKLKALVLDENHLTPAGERAVKKAFPFATTADQKEPDTSIPGEVYYYVSVAE
jgi:uncharacterized protein (TIGR02996 family)